MPESSRGGSGVGESEWCQPMRRSVNSCSYCSVEGKGGEEEGRGVVREWGGIG